jgi:hypothetical protein
MDCTTRLKAINKPDLHLFEGMDQLQTVAAQLRLAMGKEVNMGDRDSVHRNQADKIAQVEEFLNVLPGIKQYLMPLASATAKKVDQTAQGGDAAPPPLPTVTEGHGVGVQVDDV